MHLVPRRPGLRAAFISFFLLVLGACATGHTIVLGVPTTPLRSFTVLEVQDCTTNEKGEKALKVAQEFADRLVEKVVKYNESHAGAPLFGSVTRASDKTEGVLQIQTVLLEYKKGSGAARYVIGFGAGQTRCTVQCTFIDKGTSKEISKANFEGEVSIGFLGGSSKEAAGKVFDKILGYMQKNY